MYSNEDIDEIVGRETMKKLADELETFLDENENMIIIDGKKVKDVKEARETARKAVKRIRKGKYDKVFDMERLDEFDPETLKAIFKENAPVPEFNDGGMY